MFESRGSKNSCGDAVHGMMVMHCVLGSWAAAGRRWRVWVAGLCAAVHDWHAVVHRQHGKRHCTAVGRAAVQLALGPMSAGHGYSTRQIMVICLIAASDAVFQSSHHPNMLVLLFNQSNYHDLWKLFIRL